MAGASFLSFGLGFVLSIRFKTLSPFSLLVFNMNNDLNSENGIYYEYARVLASLGSAIVNWQDLEEELGRIAGYSLEVKNINGFGDVFYSIVNFRDKLNFVDASVNNAEFADHETLKKWSSLKHKVSKSSRKRNFLAHSHLMRHHKVRSGGKFVTAKPGERYRLGPSLMHNKKIAEAFNAPEKYTKTLKQIEEIDESFKKLTKQLRSFYEKMKQLREQHGLNPQ